MDLHHLGDCVTVLKRWTLFPLVVAAVTSLLSTIVLATEELDFPVLILGDLANETALRLSHPNEFTKIKNVLRLKGTYEPNQHARFRVSTRAWYDAVFDLQNNYPKAVEEEYETELAVREAFLDVSRGSFFTRIGLQQIVWGEAPGVFVADVVNPKDFREFVLPDFEEIRIPVWAVNSIYFFDNFALEGVWIPIVELNKLPARGSEFEFFRPPSPPGVREVEEPLDAPSRNLENSEIGARLSWLVEGWDLSFFYLYAYDNFPVFFREISLDSIKSQPVVTIQPRPTRVHIAGATFAKSWKNIVLKGEIAYTVDRFFQAGDLSDFDGVVKRNSFDHMIGMDCAFSRLDLNMGFTGNIVSGAEEDIEVDKANTFFFIRGVTDFDFLRRSFSVKGFFIIELEDWDYRFSPELTCPVKDDLGIALGMDIFVGDRNTLYGQFHDRDRVWLNLKYTF